MKIRKGFVSNSSSSSFVVAFKKMPENENELQHMLFGARQEYPALYDSTFWPVSQVASIVWNDIKNQTPNNDEALIEAISCGWFQGRPMWDDTETWEDHDKNTDIAVRKVLDQFKKENKDAVMYHFSYSDNEGELNSAMEHGILFDNLPHITISCH
jgi:hypothetical protein